MGLGILLGGSLVVGVVVASPVSGPRTSVLYGLRESWGSISLSTLTWPAHGGAAVAVVPENPDPTVVDIAPTVTHGSTRRAVPIASLTKMMTALVTLRALPLAPGATGPCLTVTSADRAIWLNDTHSDQSNVAVLEGEQLCERDLLTGLLVHSANNYAYLLARLVSGSVDGFVADMQREAQAIAPHTRYVEPSGYDPRNISTPADQIAVARALMSFAVARQIVGEAEAYLPVAGMVHSYTPFVGTAGVVGVKSGRTRAAGGCVVLALERVRAGERVLVYSAVFSQYGGDVLAQAGTAGLALGNSALAALVVRHIHHAQVVGTISWGSTTHILRAASTRTVMSWGAVALHLDVVVTRRRANFPAHSLVGELRANGRNLSAVRVGADVAPPQWWKEIW